eukprot:10808783-Karenia_brevis.AAC.1
MAMSRLESVVGGDIKEKLGKRLYRACHRCTSEEREAIERIMNGSMVSSKKKGSQDVKKKPAASPAMTEIVPSSDKREKNIDLEDWVTNKSRKKQQIEDLTMQNKANVKKPKKSCPSKSRDQEQD